MMGDLIVMSRVKPLPPREHFASAEILFFTGVRYYRMLEDEAATPAAAPPGAKILVKRRRSAVERRHRPNLPAMTAIEALV